uniref:NTR domain-containing protein n=1 Tax=Strongyloides venezuelensis TaxID=75913 RepID=A0A0K0FZE0_STRVS
MSNIVKICSSAYIWVTGKPEQYNPMNMPVDIKEIEYEIRVAVIDAETKLIVAKEEDYSSRTPFHININNIPDDWQKSKVYLVVVAYWTKLEKGLTTVEHVATATKKIPGPDCECSPLKKDSKDYKCTLTNIDPNKLKHRFDKVFARLWELSFLSLDPWSSGADLPEISIYV